MRTCLTTGLQALSPASLSLLQTVCALMEGVCVPSVTRAGGVAILYLSPGVMVGCTDPVQVLLHVGCHCEDDQLSVLSPCSAVLGVSQYGHCNLLPWPDLQSSCLLAACLRHVHADEQGPWASFFWRFSESVERTLYCPKFS